MELIRYIIGLFASKTKFEIGYDKNWTSFYVKHRGGWLYKNPHWLQVGGGCGISFDPERRGSWHNIDRAINFTTEWVTESYGPGFDYEITYSVTYLEKSTRQKSGENQASNG